MSLPSFVIVCRNPDIGISHKNPIILIKDDNTSCTGRCGQRSSRKVDIRLQKLIQKISNTKSLLQCICACCSQYSTYPIARNFFKKKISCLCLFKCSAFSKWTNVPGNLRKRTRVFQNPTHNFFTVKFQKPDFLSKKERVLTIVSLHSDIVTLHGLFAYGVLKLAPALNVDICLLFSSKPCLAIILCYPVTVPETDSTVWYPASISGKRSNSP